MHNEFKFGEKGHSESFSVEGIMEGLGGGGDLITAMVLYRVGT